MVFPIYGPSNYHILLMDYSCISFILQGNYLVSKSPTHRQWQCSHTILSGKHEHTQFARHENLNSQIFLGLWHDMMAQYCHVQLQFIRNSLVQKTFPRNAGWEEAKHLPQLTHLAVMRSEIMIWLCSSSSTIAEITVWEGRSCITAQPVYPVWLWTGITL